MFDLTGKLAYMVGFTAAGKPIISLEMNERTDALQMVDALHGADVLSIKIGKKTKKRSLDANAYAWVMLTKLAEKLNKSKTEIYREFIPDIGGNSETVCVQDKAVQKLCEGWEHNGLGWLTETFPSKLEGCTNVNLYYGSSTYDTHQMSRLINLIVQDCREQGIETKSAEEIDSLLRQWGGR